MADVDKKLRDRVMAAWYRSNGLPISDATFQSVTAGMDPHAYGQLAEWFDGFIKHHSGLAGHANPSDKMIHQAVAKLNQGVHELHGANIYREAITRRLNTAGVQPGMKLLKGAGVVAGVGMIGHGLYGALNATTTNPHTGEQQRDWRKTVLRLGEATAGAGLSWASYVARHGNALRIR
jgi:hypothetical protein